MTRKIQAAERSAQQLRDALAQIESELDLLKAEEARDTQQATVNKITCEKNAAATAAATKRAEAVSVAEEQSKIAEQIAALTTRQSNLTTKAGDIQAALTTEEQIIQTKDAELATEGAALQACNTTVEGLAGNRPPLHRRMVRAAANAVLGKFTR